ncbi:hypothetical protein QSU92_12240 [Microbacterium sp. ET2]|uniref:hypothetical protein n=1 Tax=Microbacterium albipurpureum TaxID=3050384 RepID=UPI00259D051F|nr:hypothetical protein [Microbacterium sp. ET2 (Ac-2212)]WJL94733.1 hypothetical protein QSU92_12240 [Microbacterium sp. ET2 (Ac-2212)]
MDQPTYVRRLLNQKVLLIIGLVVSVLAGLLAGFTIVDGQVQSRVTKTYMAASTVLLTSPQPDIFQTEIPGVTQEVPTDGTAPTELVVREPTPLNLSQSAIILAYLASSDEVIDAAAQAVGGFEDGDGVTAVRRTTQPAGDERFGGRLELPIIDITGVSTSAERAEEIAAAATVAFNDLVVAQQNQWEVPENIRLALDELNAPVADEGEGSNPAIPVIVTTVGVFLLFIALALLIEAIRDRRRRRSAPDDDDAPATRRRTGPVETLDTTEASSDDDIVPAEEPVRTREPVPVGAADSDEHSAPARSARSIRRRSRGATDERSDDLRSVLVMDDDDEDDSSARRP